MRKYLESPLLRVVVVVPFVVAVGCGPSTPLVAVIPRTTGSPLWGPEHAGAVAAAAGSNTRLYWNAPTREDDVQGQIELVEKVIDKGCAGLVLAPDQSLALITPVRRALSKGIPTVIVGSPLPMQPGGRLSYIVSDDEAAGQIAAARIGAILKAKGTVAILGVNPDIAGILERVRSFEKALARSYPGITIVEKRTGSFNVPYEQQTAEETLIANPGLDAILAVTTDSTRASYSALNELHRAGSVKLVGCDQDLLQPLVTGEIDSVIIENTYQMGYEAIKLLAAERIGQPFQSVIKLSPKLVTKENLNSPDVQQMLGLGQRQLD